MKKLLTIALVACIGSAVSAQEMKQDLPKARVESEAKLKTARQTGKFEFQLPATATAEEVKKTAAYYTQYFTVDFDNATKKAKINMVNNDPDSRRVIIRFLGANHIETVSMEGKDYKLQDFYDAYLQ